MPPPVVTAVVAVDVADLTEEWHPDPRERVYRERSAETEMLARLSCLQALPNGALVKLRVGEVRPPYSLGGLHLAHLRFEVEGVGHKHQVAAAWVAVLRRVTE